MSQLGFGLVLVMYKVIYHYYYYVDCNYLFHNICINLSNRNVLHMYYLGIGSQS